MNVHSVCLDFARTTTSPVERIALLLIARRIEASQESMERWMAVVHVVDALTFGAAAHRVATHIPTPIRPDPRTVN